VGPVTARGTHGQGAGQAGSGPGEWQALITIAAVRLVQKCLRDRFRIRAFVGPSLGSAPGMQLYCAPGGALNLDSSLSRSCGFSPA
jgi:hypothetical protein